MGFPRKIPVGHYTGTVMPECERYIVSGRVQGVGFRAATASEARRLGLRGWVRNLPDGRVETVAKGEIEALEILAAWLQRGPPGARVDRIERVVFTDEIPSGSLSASFSIR